MYIHDRNPTTLNKASKKECEEQRKSTGFRHPRPTTANNHSNDTKGGRDREGRGAGLQRGSPLTLTAYYL